MALLHSLRVQHLRVHADYTLALSPNVTIITGANGSGKTSLLEAIYITLQGSSFKGSDKDIVQRGASWYRIDGIYDDSSMRTVKFDADRQTGRKQFIIDDKTHYRLPSRDRFPVVLFEPDDLRLLHGSPERRRRFIDRFISQIDPLYYTNLRKYDRALKQRNSLLKQQARADDFFAWNVSLSEYGAYIIKKRLEIIQELNSRLTTIYHAISGTKDSVSMKYSAYSTLSVQQKLLAELHHATQNDRLRGYTTVGPHRHDVLFSFNASPAVSVASRGETRSVVLALKFLEIELTERFMGSKPVVLLDDVFSELDDQRQQYLTTLTKDHQIIITSATRSTQIKTPHVVRLA